MRKLFTSAVSLSMTGAMLSSAPAIACTVARDFLADFAAGYPSGANRNASRGVRFEAVVLARVISAAPTLFEHGETSWRNPYRAGTAAIERTLFGHARTGSVGISQSSINSCGPTFDMPKPGQFLIIYFERGLPPGGITTSSYELDFATMSDRRVREALAK